MTEEEFCQRFTAHLVSIAGPTFADGESVAAYAAGTAPSYYEDERQREMGPEECASSDFSYWED